MITFYQQAPNDMRKKIAVLKSLLIVAIPSDFKAKLKRLLHPTSIIMGSLSEIS